MSGIIAEIKTFIHVHVNTFEKFCIFLGVILIVSGILLKQNIFPSLINAANDLIFFGAILASIGVLLELHKRGLI